MKKSSIFICSKGYLGTHFLADHLHRFSSTNFSRRKTSEGFCYTLGDRIEDKILNPILKSDYLLYCLPPSAQAYEQSFCDLVDLLTLNNYQGQLIFISSTSVFNEGQGEVNEEDEAIPSATNGKILLRCENYLRSKLDSWLVIRPGGIIGPGRHPATFFKNNVLPSPLSPLNLIHIRDLSAIIMRAIELKLEREIVHAVQTTNLLKKDFYQLARAKIQGEVLSLDSSHESASKKIVSIKLKQVLKYDFVYPTIEECLNHL
jgi:hypothetical protein